MRRRILIIDDHDDLATALQETFSRAGHEVITVASREAALVGHDLDSYDVVITDLDLFGESSSEVEAAAEECLPDLPAIRANEHIKAFKLCAAEYRREDFNEDELRYIVETVLNYKIRFVDRAEVVQHLRESIEFELPSSLALMHVVLDYLTQRVEKLGVVSPEKSNLFVALDEAFVNAVKHGNKFDTAKLVKISAEVSAAEARFTVEDEGDGFDVKSIPDPLDPENLFKTSGRGVLFIYNIMDEVEYNERGNRLTMVKRSDAKTPKD
jgi:serine/threonine-protein kinase RsbW